MITITPTDRIQMVNGRPARLWSGVTTYGPCDVWVALVGTDDPLVQAYLENLLTEQPAPPEMPDGPHRGPLW